VVFGLGVTMLAGTTASINVLANVGAQLLGRDFVAVLR